MSGVRFASLALVLLCAQQVHAEGGLPGSPRAITDSAPATTLSQDGVPLQTTIERPDPGGAIFNPLAETPASRALRQARIAREVDAEAPTSGLVLMMTGVVIAAAAGLLFIAFKRV